MKQSYHSDFAIQYQLGLLDEKNSKNIPKSTKYSWKNRDFSKLVGSEISFSDEKIEIIKTFLSNQSLLKAAKGLFFIYSTWISITDNMRGMKSLMRKNIDIIVKTIDLTVPLMGLKHACKLFKISQNQYYAWKRKIICPLSPLNECVKQNSLSISPSELHAVKTFVQNDCYKDYSLATVYYEMMRQAKAFMSLTTFYKYAKLFDDLTKRKLLKAKQKTGIRTTKPKEIIHADVCV
jgi:hypothetical protein